MKPETGMREALRSIRTWISGCNKNEELIKVDLQWHEEHVADFPPALASRLSQTVIRCDELDIGSDPRVTSREQRPNWVDEMPSRPSYIL